MEMTKASLKALCRKDNLYGTPALNDKLYLHYKGFRAIASLEEYTGLKVLWLEGNGFVELAGLDAQTQLVTLYAQENLIEAIAGLQACVRKGGAVVRREIHGVRVRRCVCAFAPAAHAHLVPCPSTAAARRRTQTLLDTLNLSKNRVRRIEGLSQCTKLRVRAGSARAFRVRACDQRE